MKDLYVLTADKPMEFVIGALITERRESLGLREIDLHCANHAGRDGGLRVNGFRQLELPAIREYAHALMVLDLEGCGLEISAVELESELDKKLATSWGNRAKAIVIDPELEIWLWGAEISMQRAIRWNRSEDLREWVCGQSSRITLDGNQKPHPPKDALVRALKEAKKPNSAAVYRDIIKEIGLKNCSDPSFQRLRDTLRIWFPAPTTRE